MPFYIVTDNKGKAHLVEAAEDYVALGQVPGGESVRIAQALERIKMQEQQKGNNG